MSAVSTLLQFEVDPSGLAVQMGASAAIGAVIGFAAKKVAKIVAIVVGLQLVFFKFLETRGIVQVNWEKLGGFFEGLATQAPGQAQSLVDTFVSTAGIGVGFAAGFYLGLRWG
jgi:uncharacterized membrane protein (Fun14 family)